MKVKPQILFELALFGLLLAGLAFVLGSLRAGQPAAPVETPLEGTEPYPPPMTETPIVTFTREPTPTYVEATPMGEIPPTETPWPTFTPYPSPTLRPGPTATPIPIIAPAPDASGRLFYLVATGEETSNIYYLKLGPNGEAISPVNRIRINLPKGDVYPSLSGDRVAIIRAWGVGTLFDRRLERARPFAELLPQEVFYNWSPDNRRALMRANDNALWLADPESGDFTPLAVPDSGGVDGAALSPDGSKVFYSYVKDFNSPSELWMVNADGRDARLLFTLPSRMYRLAWSPDGTKVAFFGEGLMVMNADGSNLRTVGQHGPAMGYLIPPAWSPNSQELAWVTSKDPDSFALGWDKKVFEGTNIYLVDVTSGKERPILPDGSTGNIDPAWSPDGRQIAFVSNRGGTIEIWAINVDGSNLRALTNDGLYKRFPFWRRGQ